jgi:hypothetical protein
MSHHSDALRLRRVPHHSTSKHPNAKLPNSQTMFFRDSELRGFGTSKKFSFAHFKTLNHRTSELLIKSMSFRCCETSDTSSFKRSQTITLYNSRTTKHRNIGPTDLQTCISDNGWSRLVQNFGTSEKIYFVQSQANFPEHQTAEPLGESNDTSSPK